MNTKYIISLTALIALTGALSYGAADKPNPETPIGSLALLYAEGSADQAPGILTSLYRKDLLQLATIGCTEKNMVLRGEKESKRFPNLYQDAMDELFRQKEKFRQFLQQHNGDLQQAFSDAVRNDKAWAIDYLVQNGADVNAQVFGITTALICAACNGHEAVVAQLIAAKADVNVNDNHGFTALMWAARNGHEAVVAQLIAARANVDAENNYGRTALILVAQNGHEAVAAQLIAAGAKVDTKDIDGQTALYWAAVTSHEAVVTQLLSAGADVNTRNDDGDTPLWYAANSGDEAIAKLLIKAGADVTGLEQKLEAMGIGLDR